MDEIQRLQSGLEIAKRDLYTFMVRSHQLAGIAIAHSGFVNDFLKRLSPLEKAAASEKLEGISTGIIHQGLELEKARDPLFAAWLEEHSELLDKSPLDQ